MKHPSRSSFPRRILTIFFAGLFLAPPLAAQPGETYRPGKKPETPPAGKEQPRSTPPAKTPPGKDMRDEGRDLFKPPAKGTQGESASSWSIVLIAFRGDAQEAEARRGLAVVQNDWGLPDAYLDRRGQTTVIAFGRYTDPQTRDAQADLQRVRAVEAVIEGERQQPFEFAFLAPPANIPGSQPDFDLRNAQKIHGKWAVYTLQVGLYRRDDGKQATAAESAEFRRMAEEAVLRLRREGEQAFYFHGPTGSTVTVGLFGVEDFDAQLGLESPRLRTLRQRYPHNLLNGAGIKRRMTVTDKQGRQVKAERLDPSMLVAVPKAERN
jgi:hypothetical protein